MMETAWMYKIPRNARRSGVFLAVLSAAFALALLYQTPAWAGESFTWTGEGKDGGDWTNACNWYPKDECQENYPGKENPDDHALIKATGSGPAHVILGKDVSLASLVLEGEGVSLTGGSVRVKSSFSWTGGSLDTNITTNALTLSSIDGRATKVLNSNITNNGLLLMGPVPVGIGSGSKIINNGRLSASEGALISGVSCCVNAPRIENNGKFTVSDPIVPLPGSDHVTVDNVFFDAGGTVDTGDGVLELRAAPGQIRTGARFVGDGKISITDNADVKMLGPFSVSRDAEIELASCSGQCGGGRLLGTGVMGGDGHFVWTGGEVAGNLKLDSGIESFMSGPAIKDLSGVVTNEGRFVFLASDPSKPVTGQLKFGSRAKFNNNNVFIADERTSMAGLSCCNLPATFDNVGHFAVRPSGTTTPGTVTVSNMLFRSGGSIHLERGALELRRGLGALGTTEITGKGTLRVTDLARMALTGAFNLGPEATLELGSCSGQCGMGQLVGEGTLQGGGRFLWLGGLLTGTADLTIAGDSEMVITGTAPKELHGTITNEGEAHFLSKAAPAPASGPLMFVGQGLLRNAGTFTAGDRTAFKGTICCVDPAKFVNLGTGRFVVSEPFMPDSGTVSVANMVFENRGTVELASGKLLVGVGGYEQFAGSTRLAGGTLESSDLLVEFMGGTLAGTGTIRADVRHAKGTLSPGAPGTADSSTGVLRIAGEYLNLPAATVKMDLKGTTAGRGFDQLQVTGTASLNGGTLDLDTASGFAPGLSTNLKVLTAGRRSGTFGPLKDPGLPNGREWFAAYHARDVTLGVSQNG